MIKIACALALALTATISAFAQTSIRDVDFNNFTYEPEFCGGEDRRKLTVKNGEFSEEKEVDGYTDRTYFSVFGVTYGDLDKDGREEAVVASICNTGGTGNFTEAYVYTMKGGEPSLVVTLEGGDRAYGGIREIRIENGEMIVETNDPGEFGGACCPELIVTRTYKLKGGTLEETAKPSKREIYPAERISFAKGSYSADINVELDNDTGIKRFVIGASSGQTLTVTAASENVRFRLVKGEADIDEENKSLSARLLENGDYVFEVRNFDEQVLKTTITVTIK